MQDRTREKSYFGGFPTAVFGALACGAVSGLIARWAGPELGTIAMLVLTACVGWSVLR